MASYDPNKLDEDSNININELEKIENARILIEKETQQECYLVIKISWSDKLVLPYDDGVKIIKHLKYAQLLDSHSGGFPVITPISSNITCEMLSRRDYINYKMSSLLETKIET